MKLKIKLLLIMILMKIFTTQKFNKLTSENYTARLKQSNLVSKSEVANFVKNTELNNNELNELSSQI